MSWLGKVWTSPNTLLGLVLGVAGVPFGSRPRRGDNAVVFLEHPFLPLGRARAITFGNCVLYRRGVGPDAVVGRYDHSGWQRIGDHERAHTVQYERWGPLFLPVYVALWLAPGIHPFERQADRWAARDAGRSPDRSEPV